MFLDVKHMVSARRYETLTVHHVLQNLRTSDCEWLMPHKPQSRVSETDALKRRELLEEFIYWYFDAFLIPLLKVVVRADSPSAMVADAEPQTTFYITESSAFRNRVLYFRHDDWSTLCAPLVEKLSTDTFQRIEQVRAH